MCTCMCACTCVELSALPHVIVSLIHSSIKTELIRFNLAAQPLVLSLNIFFYSLTTSFHSLHLPLLSSLSYPHLILFFYPPFTPSTPVSYIFLASISQLSTFLSHILKTCFSCPSIGRRLRTHSCIMLLLYSHLPIHTNYVIIHFKCYVENTSETFWKMFGHKRKSMMGDRVETWE